jgi:hypothetical protein
MPPPSTTLAANAVFEAHNRLPQDGMYNSLAGDHDAVMQEYNDESTPQQQGTGTAQSDGLPWEQTGNPPPNLLAWVPPQQSTGIDQNTGLPWEQIGSPPQDYVAWRPGQPIRSTTSDPSRAYELEEVDMTLDNSLPLDSALFLQQSAIQWWANSQAALA